MGPGDPLEINPRFETSNRVLMGPGDPKDFKWAHHLTLGQWDPGLGPGDPLEINRRKPRSNVGPGDPLNLQWVHKSHSSNSVG
jgi:hypothetical protein